jgi:hypothetical protein
MRRRRRGKASTLTSLNGKPEAFRKESGKPFTQKIKKETKNLTYNELRELSKTQSAQLKFIELTWLKRTFTKRFIAIPDRLKREAEPLVRIPNLRATSAFSAPQRLTTPKIRTTAVSQRTLRLHREINPNGNLL